MTTFQFIYLALLLIGSAAALSHGSKIVVLAMWANFIATMALAANPYYVMALDAVSAGTILAFVSTKSARTVAFIFCLMIFIYPLAGLIGNYATYTIVDVLAYVQIFAMGGTGFGTAIHYGRRRFNGSSAATVSLQKIRLDIKENDPLALGKGAKP